MGKNKAIVGTIGPTNALHHHFFQQVGRFNCFSSDTRSTTSDATDNFAASESTLGLHGMGKPIAIHYHLVQNNGIGFYGHGN